MKDTQKLSLTSKYWLDSLKPVFKDKKVIIVGELIAGLIERARDIKSLGAESTFMLSTNGMGVGVLPDARDGPYYAIEGKIHKDIVQAMHYSNDLLKHLPIEVLKILDKYDPYHEAIIIGGFLHELPFVAGRKSFAYRKPEWLALDDKTVVDKFWDEAGIKHAPSEIVDVDKNQILASMKHLKQGQGVVISADSKLGVNGGAVGTSWVKSEQDIIRSLEYYQENCDKIRVMPFLEGIPCSIHGMVFDNYVATFRPVEMLVLRNIRLGKFFYCGASTLWDPKLSERNQMRTIAKKVGQHLKTKVNYRGIYDIDGIMTDKGFIPTELNTRSGAGIKALLGSDTLPLEFISQTLVSGEKIDFKPKQLENYVLMLADKNRFCSTWAAVPSLVADNLNGKTIKIYNNSLQWSDETGQINAVVQSGYGVTGGFIRLGVRPEILKPGQSFAPYAKKFWALVDPFLVQPLGKLDIPQNYK